MQNIDSGDQGKSMENAYLYGKELLYKKYEPYNETWDHDHCAFCWLKFSLSEKDEHYGYVTTDNYHWICKRCFQEYMPRYKWCIKK